MMTLLGRAGDYLEMTVTREIRRQKPAFSVPTADCECNCVITSTRLDMMETTTINIFYKK
jgi:hypothetical protein